MTFIDQIFRDLIVQDLVRSRQMSWLRDKALRFKDPKARTHKLRQLMGEEAFDDSSCYRFGISRGILVMAY